MQFYKILSFILAIASLQACQTIDTVIAQSEGQLTFEVKDNWDYAAKVAPDELIQQVRDENIDDSWIGDPRRFSMIKVKNLAQKHPLYLVEPSVRCESNYCPKEYHRPLCGSGGCSYFIYLEENGQYRKVFAKLFRREGSEALFKISSQIKDGVPACIELSGIDDYTYYHNRPPRGEDSIYRSRYCYNGREYILNKLYQVPASPSTN